MYGWDRRWRDYEADGMAGQPIVHCASDNFERMRAQVGDVVYVVANRDGQMILVGRMTIDHVVGQFEAEMRLGRELIDRRAHVLTDAPDTIVRFDRVVPEDVARSLRSVTGAQVKFASDDEYRLAPQALMPMIRLTDESAAMLDALLEGMPGADGDKGPRDPAVTTAAFKQAVELRAVDVAAQHFRGQGYDVKHVGDVESYDLDCRRGDRDLHVEVKGTIGHGEALTLTGNEVDHAREQFPDVALAIVDGITVGYTEHGPVADGGNLTLWDPWEIDTGALAATVYRYEPPR